MNLHAVGRRGSVAEKLLCIGIEVVDPAAATAIVSDHLREACREDLRIEGSLKNALPRLAAFDDASQCPLRCRIQSFAPDLRITLGEMFWREKLRGD